MPNTLYHSNAELLDHSAGLSQKVLFRREGPPPPPAEALGISSDDLKEEYDPEAEAKELLGDAYNHVANGGSLETYNKKAAEAKAKGISVAELNLKKHNVEPASRMPKYGMTETEQKAAEDEARALLGDAYTHVANEGSLEAYNKRDKDFQDINEAALEAHQPEEIEALTDEAVLLEEDKQPQKGKAKVRSRHAATPRGRGQGAIDTRASANHQARYQKQYDEMGAQVDIAKQQAFKTAEKGNAADFPATDAEMAAYEAKNNAVNQVTSAPERGIRARAMATKRGEAVAAKRASMAHTEANRDFYNAQAQALEADAQQRRAAEQDERNIPTQIIKNPAPRQQSRIGKFFRGLFGRK